MNIGEKKKNILTYRNKQNKMNSLSLYTCVRKRKRYLTIIIRILFMSIQLLWFEGKLFPWINTLKMVKNAPSILLCHVQCPCGNFFKSLNSWSFMSFLSSVMPWKNIQGRNGLIFKCPPSDKKQHMSVWQWHWHYVV